MSWHKPSETFDGGCSSAFIISSMSKKGFSPNVITYKVTPKDHTSNAGPSYLKVTNHYKINKKASTKILRNKISEQDNVMKIIIKFTYLFPANTSGLQYSTVP